MDKVHKKAKKKKNREKPKDKINYHHSAIYFKNKKTGQWEVKNPAGSIAYNYLCGNEFESENHD